MVTVSTRTPRAAAAACSRPRCSRTTGSSAPSSSTSSIGRSSPAARRRTGRRRRRAGGPPRCTGSRCSASPASAVRPLARRIDSATRRAARAASTEPPQTSGLASASAIASILAGLTAMSRCGEQAIATVVERLGDLLGVGVGPELRPGRGSRASPPRWRAGRGSRSAGSCSSGRRRARRPSSSGGHATTTWQPRRTASATADAVPVSAPSGASTTTRSRLPAQPGSAGPGQATNGTGHHGSSTARSSRESGPAAITARGRACSRARATASVDRLGGLAGLAAYPRAGLGQRPQPEVGRCQRGLVVEAGLVEPGASASCLGQPGSAGFVDQQHRDVVADRVGQAAALADQLAGPSPGSTGQVAVAGGADDDRQQLRAARRSSSGHRSLRIRASTSSRTARHGRLVAGPRR